MQDSILYPPVITRSAARYNEAISLHGFSMLGYPLCSSLRGRTEVLTKQFLFFRTSGRPIRLHPNYRRLLRTLTRPRNDRTWGLKGKKENPMVLGIPNHHTVLPNDNAHPVIARSAAGTTKQSHCVVSPCSAVPHVRHCEEGRKS